MGVRKLRPPFAVRRFFVALRVLGLDDLLALAGSASIVYGVGLLSVAAAYIAAGTLLLVMAALVSLRGSGPGASG